MNTSPNWDGLGENPARKILRQLKDGPKPLFGLLHEVVDWSDVPYETVEQLFEDGLIEKTDKWVWGITDKGKKSLEASCKS